MTQALTARDLLTRHVAQRARRFPHLDPAVLDTSGLTAAHSRDAPLVSAIDHAVARRWLTLSAVVRSRLDRSWATLDADVKAALLVGAAQLLFMDRVPDHAAINEAVESTKRSGQPKAAGLVNAVLRRLAALCGPVVDAHDPDRRDEIALSGGGARRLREPILEVDRVGRLIEQTSHGRPLVEHWLREHGFETTRRLAYHGLVHPPVIVTGASDAPPQCTPHEEEGFYVFHGSRSDLDAMLASDSSLRVQDPGAAAAVGATAALLPGLIVDLCAGRGTKTRQLRQLHPAARIVATDVDRQRLAVLRQTFENVPDVRIVEPEALGPWRGAADLLLLDVPCSNTGVLARRVEAKYRFDDRSLQSVLELQRSIVRSAAPLLAPAGCLLYATCSIEAAENEQQALWIAEHVGSTLRQQAIRMPRGLPGDPEHAYADGGYFAMLERG